LKRLIIKEVRLGDVFRCYQTGMKPREVFGGSSTTHGAAIDIRYDDVSIR
jgi:hypothetical protein